ncbi:MAG: hypothetical protein RL562_1842 [Planctomycetota bacterium]
MLENLTRWSLALALASTGPLVAQLPTGLAASMSAAVGVRAFEIQDLALPAGLPEAFTVDVRFEGVDYPLVLRRGSTARADGFEILEIGADGVRRPLPVPPPARTYRGVAAGHVGIQVAASLEWGGLYVTMLGPDGVFCHVQPAADLVPGLAPTLHVAHRPAPLPAGSCGVQHAGVHPEPASGFHTTQHSDVLLAEIAFDCDHEFYQFKGRSIPAVVADVERTLDAANVVFERDVDLAHVITTVIVRTSEPDPYSGNDAGTILGTQFRGEWNSNQAGVRRDVAHFVTSRSMGNILGLAYVGVVCNTSTAYGLSRFGSSFGQNADVLTHELGHNWNCPHCLDTCDVMCGCGTAGGFGPNDQAQIRAFVASRNCLERRDRGLVAHWKLDETGGTTVADSGPHALGGSTVGATLGQPGAMPQSGAAAAFDGVDDTIRIPTGPGLEGLVGGYSVACWVRPSQSGPGGARFFSNGQSWWFGTWFRQLTLTNGTSGSYRSSAVVPVGTWSHVAVTNDASTGTTTFYLDGQRVDALGGWRPPAATGPEWHIGSRGGSSEWFPGDLDDVQVYDSVLSDSAVAWLYANPGEPRCAAGSEVYGVGVAGSASMPTIALDGTPRVGQTVDVVYQSGGSWFHQGVGIIGLGASAVPMFGGTILVDLQSAYTFAQTAIPWATQRVPIPLPNDPAVACARLYVQFVHVDPGAVQGVAMTPGLRITIGE